jgi:hypothetical protein
MKHWPRAPHFESCGITVQWALDGHRRPYARELAPRGIARFIKRS